MVRHTSDGFVDDVTIYVFALFILVHFSKFHHCIIYRSFTLFYSGLFHYAVASMSKCTLKRSFDRLVMHSNIFNQ